MKKLYQSLVAFAISAALFAILFWKADLASTFGVLQKADVGLVAAGLGVLVVELFIKALKWKLFLAPYKLSVGTFDVFSTFFASLFVANVTPARIGEVSRPYFLKRRCGAHFFKTLPIIIFERFLDIALLLFLALAALTAYPFQIPELLKISLLAVILIMIALLVLVFNKSFARKTLGFLLRVFRKKLPVEDKIASFYEGLAKTKSARLPAIVALTAASWLLDILILFIAALALGVSVPFVFCVGVYSISLLAAVVSSLPGGLGSMEVLLFGFFLTFGLSEPVSLSIALLYRFMAFGGCLVFSSFFLYRELKATGAG